MRQLFLIALRNLAQHTRRTLLMGGAIAGVTTLLVLLLGLANGIYSTMLTSATTLMTGHVNVAGFFKVTAGQSAPVVTHYHRVLQVVRQTVPEMEYVVARGRGWAKLVSETSSMQSGIGGVDIQNEPGLRRVLQISQGKLEDLAQPNTILIFEDQAKRLGVGVGDPLTISAQTLRGTSNTADVRVVAIAKDVGLMSKFNVLVPDSTLRGIYQLNDDTTGALLIYLKDLKTIPAVEAKLRTALLKAGFEVRENDPRVFFQKFETVNREGWTGQQLDITNWEDETSFISWTITAVRVLSFALIGVLLLIIAIGIMNTLWIAIRERTREIGTLRAIGMQRARVVAMFLIEALSLSAISSGVGAAVGVALCAGINAAHLNVPVVVQLFLMSSRVHLLIQGSSLVVAVLVITGSAMVVSLIPSFLAARLKPITAMHHVG